MRHTCRGCGYRVKIPEEWILAGKDERICCQICGKSVKLNIEKHVLSKNLPHRTDTGTVITATRNTSLGEGTFQLIISHRDSQETLAIKELRSNYTYIVGRNMDKIKAMDANAVPILIPTHFDPSVSRVHFEIKVSNTSSKNQFIIRDLNSLHKTHVLGEDNSIEILEAEEQVYIDLSDKIKIGQNTLITFSKTSD